jgi:hypothetical protein
MQLRQQHHGFELQSVTASVAVQAIIDFRARQATTRMGRDEGKTIRHRRRFQDFWLK